MSNSSGNGSDGNDQRGVHPNFEALDRFHSYLNFWTEGRPRELFFMGHNEVRLENPWDLFEATYEASRRASEEYENSLDEFHGLNDWGGLDGLDRRDALDAINALISLDGLDAFNENRNGLQEENLANLVVTVYNETEAVISSAVGEKKMCLIF